jgi:hypothetical protein
MGQPIEEAALAATARLADQIEVDGALVAMQTLPDKPPFDHHYFGAEKIGITSNARHLKSDIANRSADLPGNEQLEKLTESPAVQRSSELANVVEINVKQADPMTALAKAHIAFIDAQMLYLHDHRLGNLISRQEKFIKAQQAALEELYLEDEGVLAGVNDAIIRVQADAIKKALG